MGKVTVRYVGEARSGYRMGNRFVTGRTRVPPRAVGLVVALTPEGCCLVEFLIDNEPVRFWCPSWQLRRLVRKESHAASY